MKILIIPDIHGRFKWKEHVDRLINKVDKVVFLGDYFDSFDKTPVEQMYNFKEVCKYHKSNSDKVIMLIGNHDIHYMSKNAPLSSGYNGYYGSDFRSMLLDYKEHLKIAWFYKDHLFTHAGVSDPFWNKINENAKLETTAKNIATLLNAEHSIESSLLYNVGMDRGGRGFGGPLWVDKHTLEQYPLKGVHQHVGHTQIDEFEKVIKERYTLNFYDCMQNENWKPQIIEI